MTDMLNYNDEKVPKVILHGNFITMKSYNNVPSQGTNLVNYK